MAEATTSMKTIFHWGRFFAARSAILRNIVLGYLALCPLALWFGRTLIREPPKDYTMVKFSEMEEMYKNNYTMQSLLVPNPLTKKQKVVDLKRNSTNPRRDVSVKDLKGTPSIPDLDGYEATIASYRNTLRKTCDTCNCVKWKPVDGYRHTRVAIVIAIHDALPYLQICLRSIQTNTDKYHLYLVDDFSGMETKAFLGQFAKQDHVVLLNTTGDQPQGYTKAINVGIKAALKDGADMVALVNSDTIVTPHWLDLLTAHLLVDPSTGVLAPLSNAATWQSIPEMNDPDGGWSTNPLQEGWDADKMARAVFLRSKMCLGEVPLLNGFLMLVKAQVFRKIGLMDEKAFPAGFGEENDFGLRARKAGYKLRVDDSVFIYHHKSKSYGSERRNSLANDVKPILSKRWGEQIDNAVKELKASSLLEKNRQEAKSFLSMDPSFFGPQLSALFILSGPSLKNQRWDIRGGQISVIEQAIGLCLHNINAKVAVHQPAIPHLLKQFPDAAKFNLFIGYPKTSQIVKGLENRLGFDVVIATHFSTVEVVQKLVNGYPNILPAYFAQDYEPLFSSSAEEKAKAIRSYSRIPGQLVFAKTMWIKEQIEQNHDIEVSKILPALDLSTFKHSVVQSRPTGVHIVAMIRPTTERRNPEMTLRVLVEIYQKYQDKVKIFVFGILPDDMDRYADRIGIDRDLISEFICLGMVARTDISRVFSAADIFLDMSHFQAFGRTGIEAMAAGCVPILPMEGGVEEYAVDNVNSLVIDSSSFEAGVQALSYLIENDDKRIEMKLEGKKSFKTFELYEASKSLADLLIAKYRDRCQASTPKVIRVL